MATTITTKKHRHYSSRSEVEAILTSSSSSSSLNDEEQILLDRKITLATEGFTIAKVTELILRDRNRLSKENALTVCDYIIAMKREINPRLCTIRITIEFLAELSRSAGIGKKFEDMTRDDVLSYLDSCRKLEGDDPLHRWIGTYNTKRIILFRFFKWLYYHPDVANPDKRSELSAAERKPECIMDIPKLNRKEISCYKPSDL